MTNAENVVVRFRPKGLRVLAQFLVLVSMASLGGCGTTAYYWQAARGQWELFSEARPVSELVASPGTDPALGSKLELSARIRDFASKELALPDNGSYRKYVSLQRPFVVWNVVAAPEFSLHPEQWCFPVAGCVQYRGYFSDVGAQDQAQALQANGRDIYISGVPAYSTLGWFDDPLLSTFIHYPEAELARLIFHELAHQVVYVKDDSVFNESFAVAVENEGVRRWLEAQRRSGDLERYRAHAVRKRQFAELVERTRKQLAELYQGGAEAADMRVLKAQIFGSLQRDYDGLKAQWGGYAGFDRWMPKHPNNAWLAALNTYARRVPAFEAVLEACQRDLPCFYDRVREVGKLGRHERDARMDEFERARRPSG